MKHLQLFSLCLSILFFASCGDDVEPEFKIDGSWTLESVTGGIAGGGFPIIGEISILVAGDDLDLLKDDQLIMEADLSYSMSEFDQVLLNLDRSYVNEEIEFHLGFLDEMVATMYEDNKSLSLFGLCGDCFGYNFVRK